MNIFWLFLGNILITALVILFITEAGTSLNIWMIAFASLFCMTPSIGFGTYKLISLFREKKGFGKLDEREMMHRFARHLLYKHHFDIFAPNHITGDKGKNSAYRYLIKAHKNYPAETEKWTVEIGEFIADENAYDGLETKVVFFFDRNGNYESDRSMNDKLSWNRKLLDDLGQYYSISPSKTEKAESILEKVFKEDGIPDEVLEKALTKEIEAVKNP